MKTMSRTTGRMSWQGRRPHVSLLAQMALRQERVVETLIALREQNSLGQEEAARKIGIGYRQYQRWEAGQSMPRAANLAAAALAYGKPASIFYDEPEAAAEGLSGAPRTSGAGDAELHSRLDELQEAVDRVEGYLQEQASKAVRDRVRRAARQRRRRRGEPPEDQVAAGGS